MDDLRTKILKSFIGCFALFAGCGSFCYEKLFRTSISILAQQSINVSSRVFECPNDSAPSSDESIPDSEFDDSIEEPTEEVFPVSAIEAYHSSSFFLHKELKKEIIRRLIERAPNTPLKNIYLHTLVKENNLVLLKLILENSCYIDSKNESGETALHVAVWYEHLEAAELLLKAGADVNCTTAENETVLHFAVSDGNQKMISLLIENGADLSAGDINQNTPLHLAAEKGNLQSVRAILKQSTSYVNCKNSAGETPLHVATMNEYPQIVNELLKAGAEVNSQTELDRICLQMAVIIGNLDIVRILLKHEADVTYCDEDKNTSLHLAVNHGHLKILTLLLQFSPGTEFKNLAGETPLHRAILLDNIYAIRSILHYEADVNSKTNSGVSALHLAVKKKNLDVVQALLKHNANANDKTKDHKTPLHLSIISGNVEIFKLILQYNPDTNSQDIDGNIPLHLAAAKGTIEVACLLMHYSLINCRNFEGKTPLHLAVESGHKKMVRMLLQEGAGVNNCTTRRQSPLHLAVMKGNLKIVEDLIQYGADMELQDSEGNTCLHYAAYNNFPKIVDLLLRQNHLILNMENRNGKAPLEIAVKNRCVGAVRILMNYPVDFNVSCFSIRLQQNNGARKLTAKEIAEISKLPQWASITNAAELILKNLDMKYHNFHTTVLHIATKMKNLEMVEVLLKYMKPDIQDYAGDTVLHVATRLGDIKMVKALLKKNVNPNIKNCHEETPLRIAVANQKLQICDVLLQNGADVEGRGENFKVSLPERKWFPSDNNTQPPTQNNHFSFNINRISTRESFVNVLQ